MKMYMRIVLFSFVILAPLNASAGDFEVRGYNWGDSKEKVKEKEGAPDKEADSCLVYEDEKIKEVPFTLKFCFFKDQLLKVRYERKHDISPENFKKIFSALKEKYGEADITRRMDQGDINHWEKGDTEINQTFLKVMQLRHTIEYKYLPLIEKRKAYEKKKEKERMQEGNEEAVDKL